MANDQNLQKAQKISSLSDFTNKDKVGSRDLTDLYTFSIGNSSSFELNLTGLSDNADVELYELKDNAPKKSFKAIGKVEFSELFLHREYKKDFKKTLNRLAISKKGKSTDEQIITDLDEGQYYIRVWPSNKASQQKKIKYTLNVSATELVTEEPVPINTPPVANDDSGTGFMTDENTAFTTVSVLSNDTDVDSNVLSVASINTTDTLGLVVHNGDGTFSYNPNGKFESLGNGQTASDRFSYTVSDGNGGTDTATATITITGVTDPIDPTPNTPPVANNDSGTGFRTNEDTAFTTVSVLSNDTDVDSDVLSVTSINTTNTLGLVVNNGDGTFSYNPNGKFESLGNGQTASDRFSYTVSDGNGGTDTATATITITGVTDPIDPTPNTPPVANDDSGTGFRTDENTAFTTVSVLSNDTDVDSDVLSVTSINTTDTLGLVVNNGDGTFSYNPNGKFESLGNGQTASDRFSYTVSDGNGGTDTATATITITGVVPDDNDSVDKALSLTLPESFRVIEESDLSGLPSGAEPFSISNNDTNDYYRIELASRADVKLAIEGLKADLDLQLLDSNRLEVGLSDGSGTSEVIEQTLDAGTYYLQVYQTLSGEESDYVLQGSALLRDDNDTPDRADDLGELTFKSKVFNNSNTSLSDDPFSIDTKDTVDYYKVSLPWQSELRFTLTGLQGNLKMSVVDTSGNAIDLDTNSALTPKTAADTADEVIAPYFDEATQTTFNPTLAAGDYLIKIEPQDNGVVSENYTLDLAAIPIQEETFETGDTLEEAREFPISIAELNATTSFSQSRAFGDTPDTSLWVGGKDPVDYYKLVLTEKSYFSLELFDRDGTQYTGSRDNNLNIRLLQQTSVDPGPITTNELVASSRAGDLREVVGGQLDIGTYYIEVKPATEDDGAFYQMDLALFSLDNIPAITKDIFEGDNQSGFTTDSSVASFGDAGVVFTANDGSDFGIWTSSGATTDPTDVPTEKLAFDAALDYQGNEITTDAGGNPIPANDYSFFKGISNLKAADNQIVFLSEGDYTGGGGIRQLWAQIDNGQDGAFQAITPISFEFGTISSDALPSVAVGDTLYFLTYSYFDDFYDGEGNIIGSETGAAGTELWSYNSTDGLQLLSDISGIGGDSLGVKTQVSGNPEVVNETGGTAIYFTTDGGNLYKHVVGTTTTSLIADNGNTGGVENITSVGTNLYLTDDDILRYVEDGAAAQDVSGSFSFSGTQEYFDVGGTLYFTNNSGAELWYVDSADSYTAKQVTSGLTGVSSIADLTVVGTQVFFSASTAAASNELWSMSISGGNANADAALVEDISPGSTGSSPQNLTAVGTTLYFSANDGSIGAELWKYENGAATLVYDIQGDVEENGTITNSTSNPGDFVNIGNRLFFTAIGTTETIGTIEDRESLGRELWVVGLQEENP